MNKKHRVSPLPPGTKIGLRERIFRYMYPFWSGRVSTKLRSRRVNKIDQYLGGKLFDAKRVLEVGCANGQDFVSLFRNREDVEIYGIDPVDYQIEQKNFTFIHGSAESIDYPDKYFDVTISIGVLEHICPIEKLCKVVAEINRVSKVYCVIVPSIGTLLEPHAAEIFWQIRDHNKKSKKVHLNYFSDESWLEFEGFKAASVKSFWYMPPLIKNLAIFKSD